MSAKKSKEELYGIGAVAKLTGLTDHAIRVWERRYGAVVARRASNGRRVYGPLEVEKLGLLKRLTDKGLSIGQMAGDSIDELRDRAQSLGDFANTPTPDHIRVAILGDFLPTQVAANEFDVSPVDICVADNDPERFMADLTRNLVDVIVLESPVLDSAVSERMLKCMERAGAARGVIVYSFGRTRDVDAVRDSRVVVLRAPVGIDEVHAAVIRSYTAAASSGSRKKPIQDTSATEWSFAGPTAPRRFNNSQLMNLTQASTAIDCECPHHLAQLVGDLTAFEVYSANCTNRDEEDAALHRYLHQVTAQARALIEVALERVAEAEGIEY